MTSAVDPAAAVKAPPKVLVVDDYADFRNLVRFTLGTSCVVIEASDAETALCLVRRERPAVVLLDVMLPGPLDGTWLLGAIRNDPVLRGTRIALVSGVLGTGLKPELAACRADAVFAKPFSPAQLRRWVEEMLRQPVPGRGAGDSAVRAGNSPASTADVPGSGRLPVGAMQELPSPDIR